MAYSYSGILLGHKNEYSTDKCNNRRPSQRTTEHEMSRMGKSTETGSGLAQFGGSMQKTHSCPRDFLVVTTSWASTGCLRTHQMSHLFISVDYFRPLVKERTERIF